MLHVDQFREELKSKANKTINRKSKNFDKYLGSRGGEVGTYRHVRHAQGNMENIICIITMLL